MRAALVLEDGVGAVALHAEDDLLEAAGLALVGAQELGPVAAPLGIARQHSVEVARPDGGLVAADALPHLDDHVLLVRRVALDERELELLLQPGDVRLQVGGERGELGIGARRLEIGAGLPPLLPEPVGALQLLQAPADVGSLTVVVVDGGIGQALTHLFVRALELGDQLVDGHRTMLAAP